LLDRDGQNLRALPGAIPGTTLSWSPDSQAIVYDLPSGAGFRVSDLNGNVLSSYPFGHGPDWSPDGERIVMNGGPDSAPGVWVLDLTTGLAEQVSVLSGRVAWSPAGTGEILVTMEDLDFVPLWNGSRSPKFHAWIISPETGASERLPSDLASFPRWSPDGTKIVFNAWATISTYIYDRETLIARRVAELGNPLWLDNNRLIAGSRVGRLLRLGDASLWDVTPFFVKNLAKPYGILAASAEPTPPGPIAATAFMDPQTGRWWFPSTAGQVAELHATAFTARSFHYGIPGDAPLMGDWDCDGVDTVGIWRSGRALLRNTNSFGVADVDFSFGEEGDIPLAGDWNGDGCDTLAMYRDGRVLVRNELSAGTAHLDFWFGIKGDRPFAGDFDGDGVTTVGIHRDDGTMYLTNKLDTGVADVVRLVDWLGNEDRVVAADWDGDRDASAAIFRPETTTTYYALNWDLAFAAPPWIEEPTGQRMVEFGEPDWIPVAGVFSSN
jgi:hypothetical protein